MNELFVLSAATGASEWLHLPHELNFHPLLISECHPEYCHPLPQLYGSESPTGPDGGVYGKDQLRGLRLIC
jgi:hypothetical protein